MPIVAGIGGNSGNQTITMIVRAMAMGQVSTDSARRLLRKELGVALFNGVVWGSLLGLLAGLWLYGAWTLGLVMTAATTLNLLLAAAMGVIIPMAMQRFGRDPALGSSVLITACTDSGGFSSSSAWPRCSCSERPRSRRRSRSPSRSPLDCGGCDGGRGAR